MSDDKAEEDKEKPEEEKDKRKGNEFWKARTKHGKDKLFESPEILLEACYEYFQWVNDNPLYAGKVVTFEGKYIIADVPKMRAMTLKGLYLFLGIPRQTMDLYRSRDDYIAIIDEVESVIFTQKFEGAAAGLVKENLIAREIGLADKINAEITGPNGGPIQTINAEMTPVEAAKLFKEQIKDT